MGDKIRYQVYSPYSDVSNPFSDSNYEELELETQVKSKKDRLKPSVNLYQYLEYSDVLFVIIGSLMMCFSAVSTPLQTMIYGNIFLKLSNYIAGAYSSLNEFMKEIILSCGIIILLGFIKMITLWLGVSLWMILGERQQLRARLQLFYLSFYKDIEWYDTTQNLMGEVTQVNRCIEEIRSGTAEVTALIVQNLALVISLFVTSISNSWSLTLIILASAPLMALIGIVFSRLIYNAATRENSASSKASKVLDWFLESQNTVRLFNGKYTDIIRFNKLVDLSSREFFKFANLTSANMSLLRFFSLMMFVQGLWYGNYEIQKGKITINELFTCFTSCLLLGSSIFELSSLFNVIVKSKAAMVELQDFVGSILEDNICNDINPAEARGGIEFENVYFRYSKNDSCTLKDLNIKIQPNKFNFIIGKSGAGKSTLVNLLLNFYKPTSGVIRIDGENLSDHSKRWVSDNITLIQQTPSIFHLSLKDNIGIAVSNKFESLKNIPNYMIVEACVFAQLGSLIDQLDYGLYSKLLPTSLSGGQKQRVAIARAKIRNTPILILDEALSALDIRTRSFVLNNIRKWRLGKTTIYITHDFSQIQPQDYVLMLNQGTVFYEGYLPDQTLYLNSGVNKQIQKLGLGPVDSRSSQQGISSEVLNITNNENVKILSIFTIMKRFLRMSDNKITLFIGMFIALLCGLSGPVFSFTFSKLLSIMVEASLGKRVQHDLVIWSCVVMMISLFDSLTNYLSLYLIYRVSEQYINHVRKLAFCAISGQGVSFFKSNNSAEVTALIMNDTRDFRAFIAEFLTISINLVSMVILGVVWSIIIGWKVSLVGFAFIPLISIITGIYSLLLEKAENNYKFKIFDVENHNHEVISEIKSILNLCAAKFFMQKFEYQLLEVRKVGISRAIYTGFGISLYELCSSVTIGIVLFYGFQLVGKAEYTINQLLQVITLINFTILSSSTLIRQYPDLAKGQRAATFIFNIIELLPSHIENCGQLRPSFPTSKIIKFDKVSFRYPTTITTNILLDISFEIESNEIIAIVGESGSGKTTIASLLMRLYGVTNGKIEIANIDIEDIDIDWLRDSVSIVPQNPSFFEGTIYENLVYGLTQFKIVQADINECLKLSGMGEEIELLPRGIDTIMGEGSNANFSSGQLQRLAIARALVRKPSILILDECCSNLDYENISRVQSLIKNMMKSKKQLTIILITHDDSMMKLARRVIVLKQGRIAEEGAFDKLYGNKGELYNIINKKQLF